MVTLLDFSAAEYGSVICDGVEMADIPMELQEARVFKLHLRNNDLHRFPDAKLQSTGNQKWIINFSLKTGNQVEKLIGKIKQHGGLEVPSFMPNKQAIQLFDTEPMPF